MVAKRSKSQVADMWQVTQWFQFLRQFSNQIHIKGLKKMLDFELKYRSDWINSVVRGRGDFMNQSSHANGLE